MTQTSAIAASLIAAYIVFITVKSELPCYMEVLGISTGGQCPSGLLAPSGTPAATSASLVSSAPGGVSVNLGNILGGALGTGSLGGLAPSISGGTGLLSAAYNPFTNFGIAGFGSGNPFQPFQGINVSGFGGGFGSMF